MQGILFETIDGICSFRKIVLKLNTLKRIELTSIDFSRWLSKFILRTLTLNNFHLYRILEITSLKLPNARSHLLFNETCSENIYIILD